MLGLSAALMIGLSDLYGRRVVYASSALTAGTSLQLFASVIVVGVALSTTSPFDLESFLWGGVSGIGLGAGIGFYYTGLVSSTATVVAPLVSSLAAVLPFAYTVGRGRQTAAIGFVGAGLVCLGLILVTRGSVGGDGTTSDTTGHRWAGLIWGTLSGLAYALGAVGFVEAADADGWWPAVGQRMTATVVMVAATAIAGARLIPPRGQWTNGVMSGVTTAVTSLLYLAALSHDPTVGVIAISAFSAFSVLIGRLFFADTVRPAQALGVGLVVSGVAAVGIS